MTKAEQDRLWEYLVRIDEKIDATREELSGLNQRVKNLCEDGVVKRISSLEGSRSWLGGAVAVLGVAWAAALTYMSHFWE